MAMTRDCKSLALRASLVRVQPPAPLFELKAGISAFFLLARPLDALRKNKIPICRLLFSNNKFV